MTSSEWFDSKFQDDSVKEGSVEVQRKVGFERDVHLFFERCVHI